MEKILYFYQEGIIIDTWIMPDGRRILIEFDKKHHVIEHTQWRISPA